MFYEIVRIENSGPDRETFETVMKLVRRGWFRKALQYLSNWDYGEENYRTARYLGHVWNTPTDSAEGTDKVLYEHDGYNICYSDPSINGGYEALYLKARVPNDYTD